VSINARLLSLPASAEVGDPSATRTVYVTVVLLAALGVALVVLAWWLWSRTRPEPELLAPLEEMETRAWRKQDPAAQRRALDASRPAGARPVHPEVAAPAVDTDFASARPPVGFEDLADVDDTSDVEVDVHADGIAGAGHDGDADGATDPANDVSDDLLADAVSADQATVAIPEIVDVPDDSSADPSVDASDDSPDDVSAEMGSDPVGSTADAFEQAEAVDELDETGDVETDVSPLADTSPVAGIEPDMGGADDGEHGAVVAGKRLLDRLRRP
jgi:hypothetical protein